MNQTIDWLLESEPWVEYRTRLDLLGQSEQDQCVIDAKNKIISHPQIQCLLKDASGWQEQIVNSHKKADLSLHKLTFLADIGLSIKGPEIRKIVDLVMEHQDPNGLFQVKMNIPQHFGGNGEDTWGWALCDTPIIFYFLLKFGVPHESIASGITHLISLVRDNGWPCSVSPELGKFRGPGRKDDPCPYATLLMLKLLSQIEEYRDSIECRTGAEILLKLWENSRETHPYMFYMGTDFRKLKAPTLWYDIISLTDVLSQFEWLRNDFRLMHIVEILKSKADENGLFTPESEYKAWKGWDFGQKKNPSPWLTFLVLRILKRMEI